MRTVLLALAAMLLGAGLACAILWWIIARGISRWW